MRRIKNAVWSGLWTIGVGCPGGIYYPLTNSIGWTRSDAIKDYKKNVLRSDTYEMRRRRGEVRVIRLYVRDTTKGEN